MVLGGGGGADKVGPRLYATPGACIIRRACMATGFIFVGVENVGTIFRILLFRVSATYNILSCPTQTADGPWNVALFEKGTSALVGSIAPYPSIFPDFCSGEPTTGITAPSFVIRRITLLLVSVTYKTL
jgi:ABC-type uncharacterized transport system permease subunit